MAKRKLDDDTRQLLQEFLIANTDAIIDAELQTYKETNVSEHTGRMYIFTTFTMGLAQINAKPDNMSSFEFMRHVVNQFKRNEKERLDDEARMMYDVNGSNITAILTFLPSRMFKIPKAKMDEIDPDFLRKLQSGELDLGELKLRGDFDKYKEFVHDVISVQYHSFYKNGLTVYRVVEHNDVIIDLPVVETLDFDKGPEDNGGDLLKMRTLIEVE
jgi:hypothetical protein